MAAWPHGSTPAIRNKIREKVADTCFQFTVFLVTSLSLGSILTIGGNGSLTGALYFVALVLILGLSAGFLYLGIGFLGQLEPEKDES